MAGGVPEKYECRSLFYSLEETDFCKDGRDWSIFLFLFFEENDKRYDLENKTEYMG